MCDRGSRPNLALFSELPPKRPACWAPSAAWSDPVALIESLELGNYALLLLDEMHRVVHCNPGALRLFRAEHDAICNSTLSSLLLESPTGILADRFHALCPEAGQRTVDLPKGVLFVRRPDGAAIPLEGSLSTLSVGSVRGFALLLRDVTEQVRSEERLHYLANHDALTRLPNRLALCDRLDAAIRRHHRSSTPFALLFVDLNDFKLINDQFGHMVGDAVLRVCAERLIRASRESDTVARIGGDEFIVLLEQLQRPSELRIVRSRILKLLEGRPIRVGPHLIQASASLGWALFPRDGRTADELMQLADTAMYARKRARRDRLRLRKARPGTHPNQDPPSP